MTPDETVTAAADAAREALAAARADLGDGRPLAGPEPLVDVHAHWYHARTSRADWAAVNAALLLAAWFLLPRSWLFHLTGTAAFPLALANWMFADATATNMLGDDPHRALAAIRGGAVPRLLRAKILLLWLLAAPICAVVALCIDFGEDRWGFALATVVAVAVVPFGVLGLTSAMSVWLPYRPVPLVRRWHARRDRRGTVRWLLLATAPYWAVPGLAFMFLVPGLAIWTLAAPGRDPFRVPVGGFLLGVATTAVFAGVGWAVGVRAARASVTARGERLTDALGGRDEAGVRSGRTG